MVSGPGGGPKLIRHIVFLVMFGSDDWMLVFVYEFAPSDIAYNRTEICMNNPNPKLKN